HTAPTRQQTVVIWWCVALWARASGPAAWWGPGSAPTPPPASSSASISGCGRRCGRRTRRPVRGGRLVLRPHRRPHPDIEALLDAGGGVGAEPGPHHAAGPLARAHSATHHQMTTVCCLVGAVC